MPNCHSCPHQREIDRLRRICGDCPGSSCDKHPFGHMVHIDAAENPQTVLRRMDSVMVAAARERTASRVNLADPRTVELLKLVVAEFANLTDCEAPVVCRRLRGQENWQIAHEMGVSPQVVWNRWAGLKRRNPIWAALDNGMIGLRKGGRRKQERPPPDIKQGTLI